eukprot:5419961-Prymnesium_polylepis.3
MPSSELQGSSPDVSAKSTFQCVSSSPSSPRLPRRDVFRSSAHTRAGRHVSAEVEQVRRVAGMWQCGSHHNGRVRSAQSGACEAA